MYSLDHGNRDFCPYDDKRYLFANLPDVTPNPKTHAYGHAELASKERFITDMSESPGAELIIAPLY